MKNIINEVPNLQLYGRLKHATVFVAARHLFSRQVLDIGCGYGWFELFAVRSGVKKIVGTEYSLPDLQTIRRHVRHPRVSTAVGSAIDLPFADKSFDTVVSWEVLEHIPAGTESKMFAEAFRVLKPKGAFYLSTPHSHYLSRFFDPAWWLIGHRHYSRETIINLAKAAGFKKINIEVRGGKWELLANLVFYFSKWVLRRQTLFKPYLDARINSEYHYPGYMTLFASFTK